MPVQDFTPDFSPLSKLGENWDKAQRQRKIDEINARIGQGTGPLDYEVAARSYLGAGAPEQAMSLLRMREAVEERKRMGEQFRQTQGLSREQMAQSGSQFSQTLAATEQERQRAEARAKEDRELRISQAAEAQRHAQETERLRNEPESVRLARAAGLAPGTPEWKDFIINQGKSTKLSATEMKAVNEAEAEVPKFKATIDNVTKALELNDQAYSGWGASLRGKLGDYTPDKLMPDFIADPKRGAITVQWEQLMGTEAIKNMSETLKGASTDFEMRQFLERAANPSNSPPVRKEAMQGFLKLAKQELAVRQKRAEQIRAGTQYKPGGGTTEGAGSGLKADAATLAEAKAAIATGKITREEAAARLQRAGIDPSGL